MDRDQALDLASSADRAAAGHHHRAVVVAACPSRSTPLDPTSDDDCAATSRSSVGSAVSTPGCSTGHEHAAIHQQRRAMRSARARSCDRHLAEHSRRRLEQLRSGHQSGGISPAGDQDRPIGQQRRAVSRARDDRRARGRGARLRRRIPDRRGRGAGCATDDQRSSVGKPCHGLTVAHGSAGRRLLGGQSNRGPLDVMASATASTVAVRRAFDASSESPWLPAYDPLHADVQRACGVRRIDADRVGGRVFGVGNGTAGKSHAGPRMLDW